MSAEAGQNATATPVCDTIGTGSNSSFPEIVPVDVLKSGRIVDGCTNTEVLQKQHEAITQSKLRFRFPPEPNGFLHIGHAKSMLLNFGSARFHDGQCYLRFDDTNPEGEGEDFMQGIKAMVAWMGWKPWQVTHTSDYFDQCYEFALRLVKAGKAYVDHSTAQEVAAQREKGENSPWRDRSVEENLRLFEKMRQGRFNEGTATLRVKGDMQHVNMNMRDFIAYRIKFSPHPNPRVGAKWCMYPTYDFTHCIVDSLEHVDFSLCTLEFETRRESYFWLLKELDLFRPYVWEFSRLNVCGSLLSKRKINKLVQQGVVRGYDDPRLMTLAGMRRRGYTPKAINNFCLNLGITRSKNVIEVEQLEHFLREDLDDICPRVMGIVNPIKLRITNLDAPVTLDAPNHPKFPDRGTRTITLTNEIFIDASDFHELDDNPKFYGIAVGGRPVGLKYTGNVSCKGVEKDKEGNVVAILCEIDLQRAVKPKTNISWVSVHDAAPAELRLYQPLLNDDRAATDPDFMQFINVDSETLCQGVVEKQLTSQQVFHKVQFERFGYYVVDVDSTPGAFVMNRTISLKEDKGKKK